MKAKYPGPCVGDCGGRIQPGDDIEAVPGHGHQHVECAAIERGQTALLTGNRNNACPHCNLIHAGECF